MNKVEKKFVLYAMAAIFVLLTVLLGIINGTGFTMAGQDADRMTERIALDGGGLNGGDFPGGDDFDPGRRGMGPMGPDSPEMNDSLRYFTFAFDADGSAETVAFHISAVSESEALSWAEALVEETTGWTHGTYRYRVYEQNGKTCVTVIDQGRELLSAYRILVISLCGEVLGLLLSFLVLLFVTRKLFAPLKEADRKQKRFIADAERAFKLPLTVISANTEILERRSGASEGTLAIRRQVEGMSRLVRSLGTLGIFDREDGKKVTTNLSDLLHARLDDTEPRFAQRGITLTRQIAGDVTVTGETEVLGRILDELIHNALQYALTRAVFTLERQAERITLRLENDTDLPEGAVDQIFDRFITLENATDPEHVGLGLAYVKDAVRALDGRVSARVEGGTFVLRIDL